MSSCCVAMSADLRQRCAHHRCGAHGAQRVVLVHSWHTEDGHDGVADELLDRAAVRLDDALHALEVAGEQGLQRFGIERLPQRRRPDDVAEEDGDDLAVHRWIIASNQRERKSGVCV
jgi:hypothetical protein